MDKRIDKQLPAGRRNATVLYSSLQELAAGPPGTPQRALLDQALEEVMSRLEQMEAVDDALLQKNLALAAAQEQAQNERQRYQDLFESFPEGLLITTPRGEIREANSSAARVLQTSCDRLAGASAYHFLTESDAQQIRTGIEKLSDQSRTGRWAILLKPRRSDPVPAELSITRISREGSGNLLRWMIRQVPAHGPAGLFFLQSASEDLTHQTAPGSSDFAPNRLAELEEKNRRLENQIAERRRVEDEIVNRSRELERRLEKRTAQYQDAARAQDSIARFLGDVCATPLRALDTQARLINDRWGQALPPEGRKQMASVLTKTKGLNDLLESIATYARVAKQPMERRPIDTANLITEVLQSLEPERDGRCVEVRIGDLAECVGDPVLLRLVFTHLLSNALKFTRTREAAVIEINCRQVNRETVWSIRDNGVGFRKDQVHRLFQPFQRLHRTQGYDGAGVGLATAHRIIGRHEGRIWAEPNSNGIGATFYFTLGAPSSRA